MTQVTCCCLHVFASFELNNSGLIRSISSRSTANQPTVHQEEWFVQASCADVQFHKFDREFTAIYKYFNRLIYHSNDDDSESELQLLLHKSFRDSHSRISN